MLVKKFYSSLELDEENQKHYVEGNVIFDTSDFEKIMMIIVNIVKKSWKFNIWLSLIYLDWF